MPLLFTALTLSPGLPGAGERDYPPAPEQCALEWADALAAYTAALTPPVLPPAAQAAKQALAAGLVALFTAPGAGDASSGLESAFAAYAAALAVGMAPAYVAVPPPGLVGFASLAAQRPYPTTRTQGVSRFATRIDLWVRTGTATLAVPPFTPLVWS